MSEPSAAVGLLLSDDLLFTSRIRGTAEALGLTVRTARTAAELLRLAADEPPRCVLLDLQNPGLVIEDVVRAFKTRAPAPRVIGYGSHVDTATLKRAREAGCDVVWPRSKFVEELAAALPGWFADGPQAGA
jgi:CheY-like chemotaxis protein